MRLTFEEKMNVFKRVHPEYHKQVSDKNEQEMEEYAHKMLKKAGKEGLPMNSPEVGIWMCFGPDRVHWLPRGVELFRAIMRDLEAARA